MFRCGKCTSIVSVHAQLLWKRSCSTNMDKLIQDSHEETRRNSLSYSCDWAYRAIIKSTFQFPAIWQFLEHKFDHAETIDHVNLSQCSCDLLGHSLIRFTTKNPLKTILGVVHLM